MSDLMLRLVDLDNGKEYTLWARGSFCLSAFDIQFAWYPDEKRELDPGQPLSILRVPFGAHLCIKKGNQSLC